MDASQVLSTATPDHSSEYPRVAIKRPPEDDEPFEYQHLTPKRHPVESRADDMASISPNASLYEAAATALVEPQLHEKSPADLVSMIRQMQTSHAQQISELQDQYTAVSTQLEQLKSLLNAHFTSQLGSIHLLQSNIASIASISTPQSVSQPAVTPPPISPRRSNGGALRSVSVPVPHDVPSWKAGPASTPASYYVESASLTPQGQVLAHSATATASPTSFGGATSSQTSTTKTEMKITPSSVPSEPPTVEPSHIDTVAEVWEEFRYGRAGNMSVEKLDALWGPRWRQDPKLRLWYQRRKAISDRIKLYMADGIAEQDAVMEVEKMRRGRTLNWVSRILLDDRKETRKQRKVAAQAASAARVALHSLPAV